MDNKLKNLWSLADYQTVPSFVADYFTDRGFSCPNANSKTLDEERWSIINANLMDSDVECLDIGSNIGFFSMLLAKSGRRCDSFESDDGYATFIRHFSKELHLEDHLSCHSCVFNFSEVESNYDIGLCLNVLHHNGRYFDEEVGSIDQAKKGIKSNLAELSTCVRRLWFQLGFNWKGDPKLPLFASGSKAEMIEFVRGACSSVFDIQGIWVFDPRSSRYLPCFADLLQRYDDHGEFANRPLFLLKSHKLQ